MRSLLEKAIVHLLNEDKDAATALFHQFMVERARQIHTSLRHNNEVALSEGWDDELSKEEYFADGDLDDLVDDEADGEESPISGEEGEDMGDDEIGDDFGGDEEGEEGIAGRLDDIQDQLEDLTREFEEMMAELDVDIDGSEDSDEVPDFGDEADAGDESEEVADTGEEGEGAESEDHAFAKSEDEDEDLDDITESVIAELEKVMVGDMQTDGEEIGDGGKKITQNQKSTLTQKKANPDDAKPTTMPSKQSKYDGFERETPPVTPKPVTLKSRNKVNDTTGKPDALKSVPKDGDSSALLNKDFAGIKRGNSKSVID